MRAFRPRLPLRRRGTSLVEVLVVIVVFLVGILAVAQIFPQGFRVLAGTRARSLASTLARAESERLKARGDLLPEAILAIKYVDNAGTIVAVADPAKGPNDFAPTAAGIDVNGNALDGNGTSLGDWGRMAGANAFRRVVGETHVIGAPRYLSPTLDPAAPYGGLVALQYGPADFDSANRASLSVYGRDMERRVRPPLGATPNPADVPRDYEYVLSNPTAANAAIAFPAAFDASYNLSLAVYLNVSGSVVRRDLVGLPSYPVTVQPQGFLEVPVASIPGVVPPGATLVGVETDSVRVARAFKPVTTFTNDPYEYRLVANKFGFLLFNPLGYNRFEERPGQPRQPFVARVDYDVHDWRILREDFRVPRQDGVADAGNPNGSATGESAPATYRLPVAPIRVTGDTRADSLSAGTGIEFLLNDGAGFDARPTSDPASSFFILLDLETGGIYYESYGGRRLLEVNKSSGLVRFNDADPTSAGLDGWLYLPDGRSVQTPIEGRSVRALYVARDEWAVQTLRSPARYTLFVPTTGTPRPLAGTYYLGGYDPNGIGLGGLPTRVYFPMSDRNRKVSVMRLVYLAGGQRKTAEAVDAVLRTDASDGTGLPFLDVRDVDGSATGFDFAGGSPAMGVRGASAVVRVFYNEFKFRLTPDAAANLNVGFARWLRTWKVDTKETTLTDGGF